MFRSFFRWMETRVDVFAPFNERASPPTSVFAFMWHHVREVRGWLVVILLTGLVFSGIEAALYLAVGWLVDLISSNPPEVVWRDYGGWLLFGAFVIWAVNNVAFLEQKVDEEFQSFGPVPQVIQRGPLSEEPASAT